MPTKPTIKSLYNDCFYLNDKKDSFSLCTLIFRFGIVGFQSFLKYEFWSSFFVLWTFVKYLLNIFLKIEN